MSQRFRTHQVEIGVSAAAFLVFFLAVLALGAHWRHENAEPGVQVLGSGGHLSLLITAKGARVLIATGDDAVHFGNALADALKPPGRRIDVLVLAGNERDLPVAARAVRDFGGTDALVLDGPLAAMAGELGIPDSRVVRSPTAISMPDGIEITLIPGLDAAGQWTAIITRGPTVIAVANDMERLADVRVPHATAVLTGDYDEDALASMTAPALVLPARGASLSAIAAKVESNARYLVRVERDGVARLRFVDGGLELPKSAILVAPALDDSSGPGSTLSEIVNIAKQGGGSGGPGGLRRSHVRARPHLGQNASPAASRSPQEAQRTRSPSAD